MFALVQRRCFLHIVVKQNHTVPMILPVNFKPHLSAGAWQAPAWTGEASQLQRIRICYLHTVLKHFGERGREKENERKWSCGRLELKRPVCFASSVTWDRLSWNAQQHHHKQQVKKQRKLKLELAKKELKLLEDLCEGYPAARVRWLTVKHQPWHLDNLRDSLVHFVGHVAAFLTFTRLSDCEQGRQETELYNVTIFNFSAYGNRSGFSVPWGRRKCLPRPGFLEVGTPEECLAGFVTAKRGSKDALADAPGCFLH